MKTTNRTTLIIVFAVTFVLVEVRRAISREPIQQPLVSFVDPTPSPITDALITLQPPPDTETSPSERLRPRETNPSDFPPPVTSKTKTKTACPNCRQRWNCRCGGIDYTIVGSAGSNYYSLPGEARMGGGYGVEAAVTLHDEWGLIGNFNVNHVALGEQIFGGLGIGKLPVHDRGLWLDQWSLSVMFDQFTDTRVDTIAHSLHLGQLRTQIGYSPCRDIEFGMIYTEPFLRDKDVQFRFISFPGSLPAAGRVDLGRTYSSYISRRFNSLQAALVVSYREDARSLALAGNLRKKLTQRVAAYAGASYAFETSDIGASFGLEFGMGPSFQRSSRAGRRYDTAARDDRDVVRGQGPDFFASLINVPGDPLDQPPTDVGGFDLNDLIDEVAAAPFPSDNISFASNRPDSLQKIVELQIQRNPWQSINGDGLTDFSQRQLQSQFSKFGFQDGRGGIIGKHADNQASASGP